MPTTDPTATDLGAFMCDVRIVDTHEHLRTEEAWLNESPDVLGLILSHYISGDLVNAGVSDEDVALARGEREGTLAERVAAIRDAWALTAHTGYGEAARYVAREFFGLNAEDLDPDAMAAAQATLDGLKQPAERLALLRDKAGLDHVQIDDFSVPHTPDPTDSAFFMYDLSYAAFAQAGPELLEHVRKVTGREVTDLAGLRDAIAAMFERWGPRCVAVKTQHAYNRTLAWRARDDADAERALAKRLAGGQSSEEEQLCLGDWCLARGVEQATKHNLPIKIHCGYYAGHDFMRMQRVRPSHLCGLLMAYPKARFVLMHAAYPYVGEWIALGKHFANVFLDFCWAWSIDPVACGSAVRRMIHTVSANKVFGFGGDTFWPTSSCAYAAQARFWLTRALQAEVDEHLLTEGQAIALAGRWLRENQYACFDIQAARVAMAEASPAPG